MNTRKYPRTLNEAFGPYASGPIHDSDPMPIADKIVLIVSACAALAIVVFAIIGFLPGGVL